MDEIVGKYFKTIYGDKILVLEQLDKEKGKNLLFRCQFQKYPCEVFCRKKEILKGNIINPLQENFEFIGHIFEQNCGDSLKVLEKSKNKIGYYLCEFQKYPIKKEFLKSCIKRGECYNPQIEQIEFIDKIWPQNCGDSLKVLEKIGQQYKCEFLKYPSIIFSNKANIIKGSILNPRIEEEKFINCLFPQHCGDSLKVLEKTNKKKYKEGGYLFRCQFQKYPYEIFANRTEILNGLIVNPRIEIEEFIKKEWSQKCGDIIKVELFNNKYKYRKDGRKSKLYKYTFLKYPFSGYNTKTNIKNGIIDNPNLPWKSKSNLLSFILSNFPNKKPTIFELSEKLNISRVYTNQQINKFELKDYIDYFPISSKEENEVYKYLCSIYKEEIVHSDWDILENKEIDIYIPRLKLGFEYNGDYWHSDEIVLKNKGITSKEADLIKYNLAQQKGIDLYFIWEHDWKGRQEVVKRYLRILINKYKNINRN